MAGNELDRSGIKPGTFGNLWRCAYNNGYFNSNVLRRTAHFTNRGQLLQPYAKYLEREKEDFYNKITQEPGLPFLFKLHFNPSIFNFETHYQIRKRYRC